MSGLEFITSVLIRKLNADNIFTSPFYNFLFLPNDYLFQSRISKDHELKGLQCKVIIRINKQNKI